MLIQFSYLKLKEQCKTTILESAASIFFAERTVLVDSCGRSFAPSTDIPQNSNLAFIFDGNISRWDWEMLEKNADRLIQALSDMGIEKIIYVGTSFQALPAKLAEKVSAYTTENSPVLSLFDKSLSITAEEDFWNFSTYIVQTKVYSNKGRKCFAGWESISGKNFEQSSNAGNNSFIKEMEALEKENAENVKNKLLDIMCKINEDESLQIIPQKDKVGISELKEQVVFLLVSTLEMSGRQISFFRDMYNEVSNEIGCRSRQFKLRWVWVPIADDDRGKLPPKDDRDEWLEKKMPVPVSMIVNPWSPELSSLRVYLRERIGFCKTPILLAMLNQYPFLHPNIMPVLAALGSKAFLFLLDDYYSKVDRAMMTPVTLSLALQGFSEISSRLQSSTSEMIWLYGGDHGQILEFNKKLMSVSGKAKGKIEILYVGNSRDEDDDSYKKDTRDVKWLKLPFREVKQFWNLTNYLLYQQACRGYWRNPASNRLVLALLSLDCLAARNSDVWMMAINRKSDKFSGRGKELVDLLYTNISNNVNSRIYLEDGMVEVFSREADNKQVPPDLQILYMDQTTVEESQVLSIELSNERIKGSNEVSTKFKSAPWLTAHPYSHLVAQQNPDCPFCSICYAGNPIYRCTICHCFNMCQSCWDMEGRRAEQIYKGNEIE